MEVKYLIVEEAALKLRLSSSRVRDYCRSGKLPSVRLGVRKFGILPEDLEAFIQRNNQPQGAAK